MSNESRCRELNRQFVFRENDYVSTVDGECDANDLVRHVHFEIFDGMFPHDWVYRTVSQIVDTIADGDEFPEWENPGTSVQWAASHLRFRAYVDNAMELQWFRSLWQACEAGEEAAFADVRRSVLDWLDGKRSAK